MTNDKTLSPRDTAAFETALSRIKSHARMMDSELQILSDAPQPDGPASLVEELRDQLADITRKLRRIQEAVSNAQGPHAPVHYGVAGDNDLYPERDIHHRRIEEAP